MKWDDLDTIKTPEAWKKHLTDAVEAKNGGRGRKISRRTIVIIAAAVVVLAAGVTAGASYLWPNSGSGYHPVSPTFTDQVFVIDEQGQTEIVTKPVEEALPEGWVDGKIELRMDAWEQNENRTVLPVMLDETTAQYKAMVEWNEVRGEPDPYDTEFGFSEVWGLTQGKYKAYVASTPYKEERLEEIAEKYRLELVTWTFANDKTVADELNELHLLDETARRIQYNNFGIYSDGSLKLELQTGLRTSANREYWLRLYCIRQDTMPMDYWVVSLDATPEVKTFSYNGVEGYVFYGEKLAQFVVRFDGYYVSARIDPETSQNDAYPVLTDAELKELCGVVNWSAFEELDLKQTQAYLRAAELTEARTPKSVSDDENWPYYGVFEAGSAEWTDRETVKSKLIEYYSDHFSYDGVRYDDPVYTVIETEDRLGTGTFAYTYIDVDCGDDVHFTIVTYSKSWNRIGFFEGQVSADDINNNKAWLIVTVNGVTKYIHGKTNSCRR